MGCIRLLLAIAVVLGHLPIYWNINNYYDLCLHPYYPVQIFFVISGFYMALVLNEKYLQMPNGKAAFYFNRYFRLAPTYWLILLFTIGLTIAYPNTFPQGILLDSEAIRTASMAYPSTVALKDLLGGDFTAIFDLQIISKIIFLIFTNLFMFLQDIPAFFKLFGADSNGYLLIPQGWSLGMELTFYILAPLLVRQKNWLLITFCVSSFLLRYVFIDAGLPIWPWQQRFFGCEFMFFLLGIFSYRLYQHYALQQFAYRNVLGTFSVLLFAAVIMMAGLLIPWSNENVLTTGHNPLHSLFIGLFAMFMIPFVFSLSRFSKWDRWLGEFSYPVYLWHVCLGYMFWDYLQLWNGFFLVVASIVFSIPVVLLLEMPLEQFRNRRVLLRHTKLANLDIAHT